MIVRQRLQVVAILFFSFIAFASYHEGTGSTVWLQWLTLISMLAFMLIFDLAFMNESMFIFDPDAENWRRKTEAGAK